MASIFSIPFVIIITEETFPMKLSNNLIKFIFEEASNLFLISKEEFNPTEFINTFIGKIDLFNSYIEKIMLFQSFTFIKLF